MAEQKWIHGQCLKQSGSFKVLVQSFDSYLILDDPYSLALLLKNL